MSDRIVFGEQGRFTTPDGRSHAHGAPVADMLAPDAPDAPSAAMATASCIGTAVAWVLRTGLVLAVLVAIFWRLGHIEDEVRRQRVATCLQSDYMGVDSLGPADRYACAP